MCMCTCVGTVWGLFFPETPWRAAFPHFVFIMVLADLSAPVSSSLIPEVGRRPVFWRRRGGGPSTPDS